MVHLGDEAQVKARFGLFGVVLIVTQDRCTFCAEHTRGLEIILNAPDGTPRSIGHVESRFGPFGDSISVCAR
jgi:hypothetical protein